MNQWNMGMDFSYCGTVNFIHYYIYLHWNRIKFMEQEWNQLTFWSSGSQSSRLMERTLDMCTPRPRWIPEHSIHSMIPRFMDAHVGFGRPQSAHLSLPSTSVKSIPRE